MIRFTLVAPRNGQSQVCQRGVTTADDGQDVARGQRIRSSDAPPGHARSTRGREIYRALQQDIAGTVEQRRVELIQENAQLIRSLPTRLREDTARFIAAMQMKGERPLTIAKRLQEQLPEVARSRLHLIARTETSKAATALTQARSEDLGLAYYIWKTARDGYRVRPSHRFMEGVIVPWDDTPAPEALAGSESSGLIARCARRYSNSRARFLHLR